MANPLVHYEIIDLNNPNHQQALFDLMNAYMKDPMGNQTALSKDLFERIKTGLQDQNNYLGILAVLQGRYIGLANCFFAYSTFKAAKLINIHDFIVLPDKRGQGIGRFLMKAVKEEAKNNGCCKITLEVRTDNPVAKKLYLTEGFDKSNPEYLFWQCPL